jgi:hypothetical protein
VTVSYKVEVFKCEVWIKLDQKEGNKEFICMVLRLGKDTVKIYIQVIFHHKKLWCVCGCVLEGKGVENVPLLL